MTIYYTLTFFLLAAEMATFCLLVLPLPFKVKKQLFDFFHNNYIVSKVAYGLKISFIFVGILFIDAVQRMSRIQAEYETSKRGGATTSDVRVISDLHAKKFYAERNTYLTGFTLFLSLVLTCTVGIIRENINLKSTLSSQGTGVGSGSATKVPVTSAADKKKN